MKTQLILLAALFLFSCKQNPDTRNENDGRDTISIHDHDSGDRTDTINTDSPDKNAFAEFGVTNGPTVLRLRDTRTDINLTALGTPNDTLTRVLTLEGDTHQGATITEYKYENVNLEFYTPKGSSNQWLKTVEIKGGPWATARGIRVGDSLSDLRAMYPKATNDLTEDKGVYSYTLAESVIQFGITADKVSRIKIMYEIP